MTSSSVHQPNSKTAEFARLFDLFDRVATRRSRALTGDASQLISADDIANVPAEFAPTLRNLSAILSSRALRDEQHTSTSTTRARHVSLPTTFPTTFAVRSATQRVDAMECQEEDEEERDPESPTFPLGEQYPFTFKLMLHKLYDPDEWAEKVKDVLETSKSQFKPLAERVQNIPRDATMKVEEGEREKKRNGIRAALGISTKLKPQGTMRGYRHSSATVPSKPDTSRVLKKRCIGRRKSVSGPMSTGVWVYDAAISATEVMGSRPTEMSLSKSRTSGNAVENHTRSRSFTVPEQKRKVKFGIPLQEKASGNIVLSQPTCVSFAEPDIIKTTSVVKRRRSVATAFAIEPYKRGATKRPLCA